MHNNGLRRLFCADSLRGDVGLSIVSWTSIRNRSLSKTVSVTEYSGSQTNPAGGSCYERNIEAARLTPMVGRVVSGI